MKKPDPQKAASYFAQMIAGSQPGAPDLVKARDVYGKLPALNPFDQRDFTDLYVALRLEQISVNLRHLFDRQPRIPAINVSLEGPTGK